MEGELAELEEKRDQKAGVRMRDEQELSELKNEEAMLRIELFEVSAVSHLLFD